MQKVLAKYVFCCGLGAHNPECSVTSFYSVKESACHLQQHKKLLAMHIAWMKVLVLNFSKFQIIFPWPFLCFISKKNSIFLSLAEVSLRGFPSWIACCCVPELQIPQHIWTPEYQPWQDPQALCKIRIHTSQAKCKWKVPTTLVNPERFLKAVHIQTTEDFKAVDG